MSSHGREVLRGQLLHKSEGSVWKKWVVVAYCGSTTQAQLHLFEGNEEIAQGQKPKKDIKLACAKINTVFSPDAQSLGAQVITLYVFRITTFDETHEFCAESESNRQKWMARLDLLVTFPFSAIPEEPQSNPIEESFRCQVNPAKYGAVSVWPVYIFPEEVGTRCAITGTNVLTLSFSFQSIRNRMIGTLRIINPADPSNPLVSWEHYNLRRTGRTGNLIYIEIGRQCQGGPGLVWMYAGLEGTLTLRETLRKLFRGDGNSVGSHCLQSSSPEEIKLVDLERELSETGSWMHLGLYLGLPKHQLNEIHADYGTQGLGRCKLEMLDSVLNRRGDTLSWDAVVEAVSKTGNNRIAKKIADKHGVRFDAQVGAAPPLSEELDTEVQLLKEKVKKISKRLETGETQLEACSERKHQLEGDFAEARQNHEFLQKYTSMLVEDKRMFQQRLEQREDQIAHLQSKHLEYERTIKDLEVELAGASANLEAHRTVKDKLKRLKDQKRNLVNDIESNQKEIARLREKELELRRKLNKRAKETADAERQLKLKNDELFQAKEELKLLKEENGRLLKQLVKQEKDADAAIVSDNMLQPTLECCSRYENLKVSRWQEEMEGMGKAILEKDAYIRKLERDSTYTNTSRVGLRAEMEGMDKAMDAYVQKLEREESYMNTSMVGLRAEMEEMEEEIRKLKGNEQDQHKGPLLKQPVAALGGGKTHHYQEEDKLEVPGRWTWRELNQLYQNVSIGATNHPTFLNTPVRRRGSQSPPASPRLSEQTDPPPPPLPAKQRRSHPAHAISTCTVTTTTYRADYDVPEELLYRGQTPPPPLPPSPQDGQLRRNLDSLIKRGQMPPPPLPPK